MEHIEKALARAREMRSGQAGASRFQTGTAESTRASIEGVRPDYTHTAVVQNDTRRITEQRLIADDHRNPVADVYRLLRSQVLQRMKKHNLTMLAVTSARSGEGATTTAANLAISIALDVNQTVLLVDLNLRQPSLQKKFGLEPTIGIDDYLRGECSLKDCLVNPGMAV